MKSTTVKTRRTLRTLLTALGLAAVIGGASMAPALADGWRQDRDARRWQGHERAERAWRAHEWREQAWREQAWRGRYVYRAPTYYGGYYYAPPPVVYTRPSVNLVFPFDLR